MRILIVENNPVDATIAKNILESLNYQNIIITDRGKEAIKLASTLRFDLVILGTDLSDLSEIEVCHQLRAMYPDKYTPIIAYTAFEEEIKPDILKASFDDFLFKLTGLDDFTRVIENVMLKNQLPKKFTELLT